MEQQATAPWVEFKKVSVEDRTASVETGRYVAVDVDYACVTPAGSKDCIERPVKEWFASLAQQVENGRFPGEWLRSYKARYEAWVKDEEIPVEGTSVKNWAVASPAQVEMLLKLHVRTVEQLATANEDVIGKLGMGGRSLVDKAKSYVQQSSSGLGRLAEENANLKLQLADKLAQVDAQAEQLKLLQAQVEALSQAQKPAAASDRVEEAVQDPAKVTLKDLIDTPKTRKL